MFCFIFVERKSCSVIVDVVFIIDLFGSIFRRNYGKIKVFVKGIVGRFGILMNGSWVGIILYSIKVLVKVYFNDFCIIEEFKRKVDEFFYERGFIYINKVFELVLLEFFLCVWKDVLKVVMLLIDGE